MDFYQDPPRLCNLYRQDPSLRGELDRRLPAAIRERAEPLFYQMGVAAAGEVSRLMEEAESHPPSLVSFDPWGRRVDEVRTSPAWRELKDFSARNGLVAAGYDESWGEHRRIVQAALLHLFSASSATYSCPLAMTDAAVRVLLDHAAPALRERLVPRLLSRDPELFITSGQWMTERTGGSDVGDTSTVARRLEGDGYTLHGTKWFTSSVTSEMALTLARTDPAVQGSKGLTLFCVELERLPEGGYRGIHVDRLKDKLGTRALPTAELTLDGAPATRIGEIGRGVATIATMLNITRFYNAVASTSFMSRAGILARDFALRRRAFGKPIAEHPLHAETLHDLAAEEAAAIALVFEVAEVLGKCEAGKASELDQRRLRALLPIAKLTTAKQAVAHASETLECFGGAGYVEDTGLPRLLRDAQVATIWEGTTNVLSLDVYRAEEKDRALSAVFADLTRRIEALPGAQVEILAPTLRRLREVPREEVNARRISMTTGLLAEAVYLGERAPTSDHLARFIRNRFQ